MVTAPQPTPAVSGPDRATLPVGLRAVVEEFAETPDELLLELLLEYADAVPDLPPELTGHPERMEAVPECQTRFFLAVDVDADDRVHAWFDAPREAPTTRAFAGILSNGLDGSSADEVLGVPDDFYLALGLGSVISPLRLRGMGAILGRLKRQVRAQRAA